MARHVVRRDATICPKSGDMRKSLPLTRNDVNDSLLKSVVPRDSLAGVEAALTGAEHILCTRIRPSIGTENLIPEEVNYTKITIRVSVMNEVQFLLASEPRKP